MTSACHFHVGISEASRRRESVLASLVLLRNRPENTTPAASEDFYSRFISSIFPTALIFLSGPPGNQIWSVSHVHFLTYCTFFIQMEKSGRRFSKWTQRRSSVIGSVTGLKVEGGHGSPLRDAVLRRVYFSTWRYVGRWTGVFVMLCVVVVQDVVGATGGSGARKLPASLFHRDVRPASRKWLTESIEHVLCKMFRPK